MSIHLPPIAAADQPATPPTPATGGNGASFGQFLDKAATHAEPVAASSTSQPASGATGSTPASPKTSQAAATAHGAASDGGKGDAPPVPAAQLKAIRTAKSAASAGPAHAPAVVVGDKDGALTGAPSDKESAQTTAATPAVPSAIVPTAIAPLIAAAPPISAVVTTVSAAKTIAATAQAVPAAVAIAVAASTGAPVASAKGDPWSARPTSPAIPQPAPMTAAVSNLALRAQGGPTDAIPPTATQVSGGTTPSASAAPATIASTDTFRVPAASGPATIAAPTLDVPSSAAPPVLKSSNNAVGQVVSAQAAALLGRVSVLGTGQSRPQAPSSPLSGGVPATVTGAAVAPGPAARGGQTEASALATPAATGMPAASGTPAAVVTPAVTATPLPPISGSVDLTVKFSSMAVPAHGDLTPTGAPKGKSDLHPTASATDPAAGKLAAAAGAAQAETVTVTASAKASADATLVASTSSKPLNAAEDDAADAHAANSSIVMPQPPADATGSARGVSASQPAPETQASPVAALHSVTEQVAIAVKRGVKAGNDQIQINLEPASLGKISVRLDFAQDGRVSAVFSADRADTLNLLNGDARSLEQSLRDAGLRADGGSLTFNLSSGDTGSNARHFAQAPGYAVAATAMIESDPLAALVGTRAVAGGLGHDGSLDIHV